MLQQSYHTILNIPISFSSPLRAIVLSSPFLLHAPSPFPTPYSSLPLRLAPTFFFRRQPPSSANSADESTYFADAYETYSSSAQASQSFMRNLLSSTFPLFARQMYMNLGFPIASTVVAACALALAACPTLIVIFGARLRARSKVATAIAASG